MSLNPTTNYLFAKKSVSLLLFGRTLGTSSVYLYGPGQLAGSGVPMAAYGRLLGLRVYDGADAFGVSGDVSFVPGDRVSVYATFNNPTFTITVRKNLDDTMLSVSGIGYNRDVWATVLVELAAV